MAKPVNESFTTFSNPENQNLGGRDQLGWWTRFFKKFSARPVEPEDNPFDGLKLPEEELLQVSPLRGDAITHEDPTSPSHMSYNQRAGHVPQAELERRKRYRDYEDMDIHPEIAAALDMYANDATIKDKEDNIIQIETNYEEIKNELRIFFKKIKLNLYLWDIVRNTAKYGDMFLENIVHPRKTTDGIARIKTLNPNFLFREEDEYGILKRFYQLIPDKGVTSLHSARTNEQKLPLDQNQLVHFRIRNAESQFLPYGKSILHPAVKIYKQLRLMEDAMFIYRVQRAPERRVFYIDVGQLPPNKANMLIEDQKRKLKKEKYFDPVKGKIDERFNPAATNEDFFIPTRQGSQTKIDTLPGADNLGEVDDVKYFREKILAALKIPKDYFSMGDSGKSDTNKGTLRQLDINYSRAVCRLQEQVCLGLETLCRRHLMLRNYPKTMVNEFRIKLNSPKNAEEREMLEIEEARARVLQAYKGLEMFPDEWLMKRFYGMNNDEIQDIKQLMKTQMEEQQELMGPPDQMGGFEEELGGAMQPPAAPGPDMNQTVNGDMRQSTGEEPDSDTGKEEAR